MEAIFRTLGTHFFRYVLKKLKASHAYREFKERWVRDNYDQSVREMFRAVVHDAKVNVELPEEVVEDLLTDDTNRLEVFRLVIENVTLEQFDESKLNLDAYYELHPRYADKIVPFFQVVLIKIKEFKIHNSHLDFLQIGSMLNLIRQDIDKVYSRIENIGEMTARNHSLIAEVLTSPGTGDLNDLFNEGNLEEVKLRALERLKRPGVSVDDRIELNQIIARAILELDSPTEAIRYYQAAIDLCEERPRQLRLRATVELLRGDPAQARTYINQAIQLEGHSQKNVQHLINVLIALGDNTEASARLNDVDEAHRDEIRAHLLLECGNFQELIHLAGSKLENGSEPKTTWLMFKAEGIVAELEHKVIASMPCNIHGITTSALEVLSEIGSNQRWITRRKELEAYLHFRRKEFAEAKTLYTELLNNGGIDAAHRYGAQYLAACLCAGDWESTVTYLADKLATGADDPELVLKLSRAYVERSTPQDAIQLLTEKRSVFLQLGGSLLIEYYMLAMYAAHYDVSIQSTNFVQSLRASVPPGSVELKLIDSYLAYLERDWDSAIAGFEECLEALSQASVAEVTTLLIEAYSMRAGQSDFEKLVELIPSIPVWCYTEGLVNRFVISLYNTGKYEAILDMYRSGNFGDSICLLDAATAIYFNFAWYSLAAENFNTLFRKTKEIHFLIQYARCLYAMGDTATSIDAIKRAESEVQSKGSIHDFYLLALVNQDLGQWNVAAKYAFRAYKLGKDNPDVCRFYFVLMSETSRFLSDPDPEWIAAYHDVFNGFHSNFPDEKPLYEAFNPLNPDNSISTEFIERLQEIRAGHADVTNLYNQFKMPITWLADRLGKGVFETWIGVGSSSDTKVWIMYGGSDELSSRRQTAANSSFTVMCDIGTLLTVRQLGLLDLLANHYAELLVHQIQLNALIEERRRMQLIADEGLTTMGVDAESDQIILSNASAEEVQRVLATLNELITWINMRCNVVGRVIDTANHIDSSYSGIFGNLITEMLESCHERKAALLFDSGIVCQVATTQLNLRDFTTFDLLGVLLNQSLIDDDLYINSYITLLKLGYTLLPLDSMSLWRLLQMHTFQLENPDVQAWFRNFSHEDYKIEYKLLIVSQFLRTLWLEAEAAPFREAVTDRICYSLVGLNQKAPIIQKLLNITKFSPLVEHQRQQMVRCINTWLRSQSWI